MQEYNLQKNCASECFCTHIAAVRFICNSASWSSQKQKYKTTSKTLHTFSTAMRGSNHHTHSWIWRSKPAVFRTDPA